MMKYLLCLIVIFALVIYGLSLSIKHGVDQVESAMDIRRRAEERLRAVSEIINGREVITVTEGVSEPEHESASVSLSEKSEIKRLDLKCGDSLSEVAMFFGDPIRQEAVGSTRIMKYRNCNIAIENGLVVGWSIK